MTKPKFTLTTDLVKIDVAQENHKKLGQKNIIEIEGPSESVDQLNLKVKKSIKKDFKIWCLKHNISMIEAFELAFKLLEKKEFLVNEQEREPNS